MSTIARDPSGCSRIQVETFKEVFDRMEKSIVTKSLQWPTVIEYFTKRGRPLSADEIEALLVEDHDANQKFNHDKEVQRVEDEIFQKKLEEEDEQLAGSLNQSPQRSPRKRGDREDMEDLEWSNQEDKPRTRNQMRKVDSLNDRDENQQFEDDLNSKQIDAKDYLRHRQPRQTAKSR